MGSGATAEVWSGRLLVVRRGVSAVSLTQGRSEGTSRYEKAMSRSMHAVLPRCTLPSRLPGAVKCPLSGLELYLAGPLCVESGSSPEGQLPKLYAGERHVYATWPIVLPVLVHVLQGKE